MSQKYGKKKPTL
jgi:hypothetical protein